VPRLRLVGMYIGVRGGEMALKFVIRDKRPLIVDSEPFYIDVWDAEEGGEWFDIYYLVVDLKEGRILVELFQRPVYPPEFAEGAGGLYRGMYSLEELDDDVIEALKRSKSLRRVRDEIARILQAFDSLLWVEGKSARKRHEVIER
jgi:hypothetical protein